MRSGAMTWGMFSQRRKDAMLVFFDRINASLFSFGKMVSATLQRNRIYRIKENGDMGSLAQGHSYQ